MKQPCEDGEDSLIAAVCWKRHTHNVHNNAYPKQHYTMIAELVDMI